MPRSATLQPPNASGIGPGVASLNQLSLQGPGYRTLLVSHSTAGLRFYAHNTEQDFGDAHTEVAHSRNVTFFGTKSEARRPPPSVHHPTLTACVGPITRP